MAIPVLIIGKSGSGKSTSLRNCVGHDFTVIKVLNKPFPFRGKIPSCTTDDYSTVLGCLKSKQAGRSIVIDDAGYLITNQFMRGHSATGAGKQIFDFYNKIADCFWSLVQFIVSSLPENKVVYVIMHEDQDENGNIKPKTIGKLLDEKVNIEGMFTIVLRCVSDGSQHKFITQAADGAASKSPIGMFDEIEIDNDLWEVDQKIRAYYEIEEEEDKG